MDGNIEYKEGILKPGLYVNKDGQYNWNKKYPDLVSISNPYKHKNWDKWRISICGKLYPSGCIWTPDYDSVDFSQYRPATQEDIDKANEYRRSIGITEPHMISFKEPD